MAKKILIVEDEKMLREMYIRKFSRAGYKVIGADDAKTGFKMAKKEKPDLILLDILLPKENGNYMLARLRQDPETSKIDVVAFSNFEDSRAREEATKLGVLDYLIKTDFTPKQIVGKVKEYLK